MKRLSGDQKGYVAPSVPASAPASVESRLCTQSWTLPPVAAVKASHRPSGEIATSSKLDFSGGKRQSFSTRALASVGWRRYLIVKGSDASRPSKQMPAMIQPNRCRMDHGWLTRSDVVVDKTLVGSDPKPETVLRPLKAKSKSRAD